MPLGNEVKEALRQQLCDLQSYMLKAIHAAREASSASALSAISKETAADTIFVIDQIAEEAIFTWFSKNWDADWPVEIIMEGLEHELTFPKDTAIEDTKLKCLIDPIDGTRCIMYDKRSAWILAGIAAQRGEDNTLADIEVAAMTELPTTRQWRADQLSATRGGGLQSIAIDVRNGFTETPIEHTPSSESTVHHAFGTVCRYFPAGSTLLSQIEESLWEKLYGDGNAVPVVFNDQYISTGGQFYEILSGHDRFVADIRPLVFRILDIEENLGAHPYDVVCALLLEEAGCIIEYPDGSPLDCPLDTTSSVNWVAYANQDLAAHIRPALQSVLSRLC